MKKHKLITGLLGYALTCGIAMADRELDTCVKNVKSKKAGYILKLEKLNFSGKRIYEFEIIDTNRSEWEFLCEAKTGRIIEQEGEAKDANDPEFKKNVKISEQDSAKIAIKAAPGKIEEVEYELENDGGSSYEFDILSDKGVETKIEIDASTGKVIETAHEDWEVGEEPEEKR